MPRGPQFNDISKNFTTRDSLGIEGVSISIQAEVCPVVTTVTPRAFYWPFMVWIYYDFYKYSGISERTVNAFDAYLKRQDYFFVMATLLTDGSDQINLVGKQQSEQDIAENPNGPYPYNSKYFKSQYGGMRNYYAGCISMYFITDENPEDDKEYPFPVLRPEGEKMAKAFEEVIKDTEYYKLYRRNDKAVPRTILEDYGKVINIALDGFDECKSILRHYLFEDERTNFLKERGILLSENARYLTLIVKNNKVEDLSPSVCRRLFYDYQLPSGEKLQLTEECTSIANKWEIVIGRMYFVSGIEMIWKYILEQLNSQYTLNEWILNSIKLSDFKWDLKKNLSDVIEECKYDFDTREAMIAATSKKNTSSYSIENGIRIILSVYNHFRKKEDIGDEKAFFDYGRESQSISMSEMYEKVDEYKDKSIQEFIAFVIQYWVVEQHYITALDKMIRGEDGFFYENIDGRYFRKNEFKLAFQGIRLVQLAQVMRDLDML